MSPIWDAEHYAANTAHHRAHDHVVLDALTGLPSDATIVDIGCGVGDFTRRLADLVPDGLVLGVDADAGMVAQAVAGTDTDLHVHFQVSRAQDVADVLGAGVAQAVVSTACWHWIPEVDHPQVLDQVVRVLQPGGRVAVEFGGYGQIARIRALADDVARDFGGITAPWFFPTPEQYRPMAEAAGLEVERIELLQQRRPFADVEAIRDYLSSQVLLAYTDQLSAIEAEAFTAAVLARAGTDLVAPDGSFDQDFVRLFLVASLRS